MTQLPELRRSPARAVIRLDALRRNALRARDGVAVDTPLWADLRRDGWGHGLARTADVLFTSGIGVYVDSVDRDRLGAAPAHLVTSREPRRLLDPARIWGLPTAGAIPASAEPVMSLRGTVLSTKPLRAGEGVSYGYTFRADADTTIALVSGGYAQGVLREVGNKAAVTLRSVRVPIVGRVAMDACVVAVGDRLCASGDEVVFFGDPELGEPPLAEWVDATGMSAGGIVSLAGARATLEHRS